MSVKYFDSTMAGASGVTNAAGNGISTIFDPCFVDGFGGGTLASIVVASDVATATLTAHGFAMFTTTLGPVVKITGATPTDLNREWRITSVPSANTFTFATSGISDQSATVAGSVVRAPLGWTKTYSGTNKAAYSRSALGATSMLLRCDDSNTSYTALNMYETMTDVDTGTGVAPTSGSDYFARSNSTTARDWWLYGDEYGVYWFGDPNGSGTIYAGAAFGDINTVAPADTYHCFLLGATSTATASQSPIATVTGATAGAYLSRSYAGTGAAIASGRYSHKKMNYLGNSGMVLPSPVNSKMHVMPVECWEGTTLLRGLLPGLFCPVHTGVGDTGMFTTHSNGTFLLQKIGSAYMAAIEVESSWR